MTILKFSDIKNDSSKNELPMHDHEGEDDDADVHCDSVMISTSVHNEQVDYLKPNTLFWAKGYKPNKVVTSSTKSNRLRTLLWLAIFLGVLGVSLLVYIFASYLPSLLAFKKSSGLAVGRCSISISSNYHAGKSFEDIRGNSDYQEIRPGWLRNEFTIVHHLVRNYTLVVDSTTRRCFIKDRDIINRNLAKLTSELLSAFVAAVHNIPESHDIWRSWRVMQPALNEEQMLFHGPQVLNYCKTYRVYKLAKFEPTTSKSLKHCPMYKCAPCPRNIYLRDLQGCPTCYCGYNLLINTRKQSRFTRNVPSREMNLEVEVIDEGIPVQVSKNTVNRYLDILYWD